MIKYKSGCGYSADLDFAYMFIELNIFLANWLFKVKSEKDLNRNIFYSFLFLQAEILLIEILIFQASPLVAYKFYGFVFAVVSVLFLFCREQFPYWVDDDKAEEIEEPSKSSFQKNIEDLDTVLKPAVNKEIANIHQNQAADEMAQQSSKNTGGKNTEITVNVANSLDLKNNTIVLPSQPKQAKTDDEE